MTFDQYGNLTPYEVITTDLETAKAVFVEAFATSTNRRDLWVSYEEFLNELHALFRGGFYQWLDGSFTTAKLNPNDIDIVTFVDWKIYQQHEKYLTKRQNEWYTQHKIDAYFVMVYPQDHKRFVWFESSRLEWLFLFTTTRKPKKEKGLIQLNFA
jgi:hypothetical protein